ncbi:MAG: dephospho-CoA kinase [Dehalococcoidia bacterium]|nr:dephospho-CoA kinase [Dehalococcoidia bacterium]
MIVIGLTGGIGSGKSEVSRKLQELGAEVIDADRVGHEAYLPHTAAWEEVVAAFGQEILQPSGEVDRRKLGSIVFSDPKALARLNAIMHPKMYEMLRERLNVLRSQATQVAVIEAAILIEANWTPLVDEVWVTEANEDVVVERVGKRNNLPSEEIRRRIRSQMSREERAKHATATITNNKGLEELRRQVEQLWDSRVRGRTR